MYRKVSSTSVSLVTIALWLGGCSHTALIETDPPGAECYVDGVQVGITPYQLTDTVGAGRRYEIVLQKPGYGIVQETLAQDQFAWPKGVASIVCGTCTLGLGCLGLFWSWHLQDRYAFILEPAASEPDSREASAPDQAGDSSTDQDAVEPVSPSDVPY